MSVDWQDACRRALGKPHDAIVAAIRATCGVTVRVQCRRSLFSTIAERCAWQPEVRCCLTLWLPDCSVLRQRYRRGNRVLDVAAASRKLETAYLASLRMVFRPDGMCKLLWFNCVGHLAAKLDLQCEREIFVV